jgi:hypothetical protein
MLAAAEECGHVLNERTNTQLRHTVTLLKMECDRIDRLAYALRSVLASDT